MQPPILILLKIVNDARSETNEGNEFLLLSRLIMLLSMEIDLEAYLRLYLAFPKMQKLAER